MGLSPLRGGPLPLPRTHLSSSLQCGVQPDTAGKMAAAALSSTPLHGSPSARPPDHARSRQRGESSPRSGSRHRDVTIRGHRLDLQRVRGTLHRLDLQRIRGTLHRLDLQRVRGALHQLDLQRIRGTLHRLDLQRIRGAPHQLDLQRIRGTLHRLDLQRIRGTLHRLDLQRIRGTLHRLDLQRIRGTLHRLHLQRIRGTLHRLDLQRVRGALQRLDLQRVRRALCLLDLQRVRAALRRLDLQGVGGAQLLAGPAEGEKGFSPVGPAEGKSGPSLPGPTEGERRSHWLDLEGGARRRGHQGACPQACAAGAPCTGRAPHEQSAQPDLSLDGEQQEVRQRQADSCLVAIFCDPSNRPPVPEPDATEEEKAANVLQQGPDLRAGETLPPAEVPGLSRAGHLGQSPQDDRCPGQDLVPESPDQMEVGHFHDAGHWQDCL
ncbi:hypothetical protein NDU88_007250 [Pleurodeles waltl]|uniref:Uncharacterized protein n=1 Tax=Pleurodeles waltl TaxID=8319 RepID=A0AAV7WGI8_PLEWA|nr:hypothetical protein NDU88_007250 [Pleurodeles waltl]